MHLIADPHRNALGGCLKAHPDFASMKTENHRLQVEVRHSGLWLLHYHLGYSYTCSERAEDVGAGRDRRLAGIATLGSSLSQAAHGGLGRTAGGRAFMTLSKPPAAETSSRRPPTR
jgi:hypothetical protein